MLHRKHFGERICITQPTHAWQDKLLVLGAMIVSVPLLLGKKYAWAQSSMTLAGINGKAHRHSIPQPAILTALLNFQQQ